MKTNSNSHSNDQTLPQGAPPVFATIRPFKRWLAAGTLGLLLINGNLARAQTTAVSDLGTSDAVNDYAASYFYYDPVNHTTDSQTFAQSFTTGANPVALASVTLQIHNAIGLLVDAGGFTVSLYSDSAGVPDALLAELAGNDTPKVDGPYTYTAPPASLLDATTTYWIVAAVSQNLPDKGYAWAPASDLSETGLPGWSMGAYGYLRLSNGVGSWLPHTDTKLKMAVTIVDKTPADQIHDLITLVESLGINSNVERALVKELGDALKRRRNACEDLSDFIERVRKASHKRLTVAQANLLIGDATDIQAALGCHADSQEGVGEQGDQERPHDSGQMKK
jgi:hypothetical protein